MKKIIFIIMLFCCVSFANAASPTLKWDAPPSGEQIAGYIVEYHTEEEITYYQDVGNVLEWSNFEDFLNPGDTYTFCVKAYNIAGESGPSNTIEYRIEPYVPPAIVIPVKVDRPAEITIKIIVD